MVLSLFFFVSSYNFGWWPVYDCKAYLKTTVNPLLNLPGGLFFPSTFEGGGGGLNREGGLI